MHRYRCRNRPVAVIVRGDRSAEDRHHCITDELHHRAVLVEDRPVHRRSVLVELAGEPARVRVFGDRRVATDVGHQHGDDKLLGVAGPSTLLEHLRGDPTRQEPVERFALFLAVDDRLL